MKTDHYTLFHAYPGLAGRLPRVPICGLPTPVLESETLAKLWNIEKLFIKDDGKSGPLYGGNKVRKLEFILGKARQEGRSRVMTIGAAGSNHALATSVHATAWGFKVGLVLVTQEPSDFVRRNLLMDLKTGADLHFVDDSKEDTGEAIRKIQADYEAKEKQAPFFIPAGGSSPEGTAGYVNAALELKEQILRGELPEPDRIYLPLGTAGTAAGLILGLKAAGLKSTVHPVLVVDPGFTDRGKVDHLIKKTNQLLHQADPDFPLFDEQETAYNINKDMLGKGYGIPTELGLKSMEALKEAENLKLEFTYSGKALSGIIHDASQGELKDKTVLFWNTYNTHDFSGEIQGLDYRKLPEKFHIYF